MMSEEKKDILRIANCSGFYGDRLSAARAMIEGGPIDVLTGDYLAELTMSILHGKKSKDPSSGYVGTFVKQMKDVLGLCKEKGIKVVTNAGGLNPEGCAKEIEAIAAEQGLDVKVAWIDGDNLMPRLDELMAAGEDFASIDTGVKYQDYKHKAVTANAYLGAWGIKEALDQGADVVICPRVTDAAVIIGPAAWHFNWSRDDYDALAGALVAGHLIECGPQVVGGMYSFFQEVPTFDNIGYPIAEMEADGSFTICKHPGTGGLISVGTVTAQVLYETNAPAYKNPDVIAHFDSMNFEQVGPDRVRVSGTKGSCPPSTHKVCMNLSAGYRACQEMLITGLDIEEKAELFTDQLFKNLGGKDKFDKVSVQLLRTDKEDPASNDEATATLRIIAYSTDPNLVGRMFYAKSTELGLGNYPGLYGRAPANAPGPVTEHWPALVDSKYITEHVHLNGTTTEVEPTQKLGLEPIGYQSVPVDVPAPPSGPTKRIPLGRLFGARAGDKGGAANVGVWAKTDETYSFLYHFLTADKFKELLPDMAGFKVERYELPNIKALNFFVHDVLGEGIAASTRTDGQAKSMGEYLRAKYIEVPESLVA